MAVIAIIGILAGIILGISGYVSRKADLTRVQGDLERIKVALEEFKVNYGRYWPTDGAINSTAAEGMTFEAAMEKYVADLRLVDPWNRSYDYDFIANSQYRLWSWGPDGRNGTMDDIESTKAAF